MHCQLVPFKYVFFLLSIGIPTAFPYWQLAVLARRITNPFPLCKLYILYIAPCQRFCTNNTILQSILLSISFSHSNNQIIIIYLIPPCIPFQLTFMLLPSTLFIILKILCTCHVFILVILFDALQ